MSGSTKTHFGLNPGPTKHNIWPSVLWLAVSVLLSVTCSATGATLTEHMAIACTQTPEQRLNCDYRLRETTELGSAVAEINGVIVDGELSASYPTAGDATALMLLIDTSDPARQAAIAATVKQLGTLLGLIRPHHRVGLASFDTDLYLLAEIGTPAADLKRAIAGLEAKGRTTELYRNAREAVRLLARDNNATRRVLIIFSDGLAEDYAYHHEDVVNLALEHEVIIHSVGYPRSVAQSVALQTIRRLSDETGGQYVQADHVDFSLPEGVFQRMLRATDSGGQLSFDLTPLLDNGLQGAHDLSLAFQTGDQSFIVLAPIVLPQHAAITTPQSTAQTAAAQASIATASPPAQIHRAPAVARPSRSLWPWLVALGILILATLATVLLAIRRVRDTLEDGSVSSKRDAATPLAYLVMDDDTSRRHTIDKLPWRIGRGHNNDLTIDDHSVSRLHAEIRHNEQGQLLLKDLESLNGVFVNDNRIESIQLREGDHVDIGDIRMRFTLHDETYESQEPTVMVRTHAP